MQIWEILVSRAKSEPVENNRKAALAFIAELPIQDSKSFRLKEWRENYAALLWFANQRKFFKRIRHNMPESVDVALTKVLSQTRTGIEIDRTAYRGGWNTNLKTKLTQANGRLSKYYATGQFEDLTAFWQAVFVSFFAPEQLRRNISVCSMCAKELPSTKKLERTSKAKLCNTCRQRKWRAEHLEEAKASDRERRQEERKKPSV